MKICIIVSSSCGINYPNEKYNVIPDPNWYILPAHHHFFVRYVTKANARQDINQICEEGKQKGWEIYMNFMWGTKKDKVAGVEATKYLESKGVRLLTNPSGFLEKTKIDFYNAAKNSDLLVPQNTPERYPKIVKYGDGYGEFDIDSRFICNSEEEVEEQVSILKEKNSDLEVLVQDYIMGSSCTTIVIEMGQNVVALTPVQHVFPGGTPANECFLSWERRCENYKQPTIRQQLVDKNVPAYYEARKLAVKAFNVLGGAGGAGWASVEIRLESSTGLYYVIQVNPTPLVFYPVGNSLGDDLVVNQRFPGAHNALFDVLLSTKLTRDGIYGYRNRKLAEIYDRNCNHYQSLIKSGDNNYFKFQAIVASKFEFDGTVLDLACGTGYFGELLYNNCVKAEVTGIELSAGMLRTRAIGEYYKKPIQVGPMQELIMLAGEYDHIVCFGALQFLERIQFNAVLARMFMIARKSITIEIDDLDSDYTCITQLKFGDSGYTRNNVETMESFIRPDGWRKIYEGRHEICRVSARGEPAWGVWYRFEHVSFQSNEGGDIFLIPGTKLGPV